MSGEERETSLSAALGVWWRREFLVQLFNSNVLKLQTTVKYKIPFGITYCVRDL